MKTQNTIFLSSTVGALAIIIAVFYVYIDQISQKLHDELDDYFSLRDVQFWLPLAVSLLSIYPTYVFLAEPLDESVRDNKSTNLLLASRIVRLLVLVSIISMSLILPYVLARNVYDTPSKVQAYTILISGALLLLLINAWAIRSVILGTAIFTASSPKLLAFIAAATLGATITTTYFSVAE